MNIPNYFIKNSLPRACVQSRSIKTATESSLARLKRHHSIPGLGSAGIQGHYEVLGSKVPAPEFLKDPKTVYVTGAPLSWGQPHPGTDKGPRLLRDDGLLDVLQGLEWNVTDTGDVMFDEPLSTDPQPDESLIGGSAKNCYCLGKALEAIYRRLVDNARTDNFSLLLGGDHSVGLASVAAALTVRPDTGVIWVDAHADLNVPATSPSGNMHGMPLGIMMGLVDPNLLPGFEWLAEVPKLKPESLVFVGLRDLDMAERHIILEKKIKAYTMHHVDKFGIGAVMRHALDYLGTRPIHLSYDIDAVDPAEAPSTGTVVRGGFNFREAHYIAESVSDTGRLVSMDLVEVNPTLTSGIEAKLTCRLGLALIASAMGSRIL